MIASRSRSWLYIPLLLMTFFYLVPLFIMLNTGFKSFAEVSLQTMWNLPQGLHFDNFVAAWEALAPHLWNSVRMVVPAALISCAVRLDQRLCPRQMEVSRRGFDLPPDPFRDVHPLPEHPHPARAIHAQHQPVRGGIGARF